MANSNLRGSVVVIITLFGAIIALPQEKPAQEPFVEGCCVNIAPPPPQNPVSGEPTRTVLLTALHCGTNNRFMRSTLDLAKELGDPESMTVSHFYGSFIGYDREPNLTIAVYAKEEEIGYLLDSAVSESSVNIVNLTQLRKIDGEWKVGEINGGLWSYTRLHHLAQHLGKSKRRTIPTAAISRSAPDRCVVYYEEQSQ